MQAGNSLDQQATQQAKQYMGHFAWPTVVYAVLVIAAYFGTLAGALAGAIPLWVATPLAGVLTYLAYTILHESVHGSISGSRQELRWVNETLGYIAAWIAMVPLTAHRHEHLTHHRHTNQPDADPDFQVSGFSTSPWATARAVGITYTNQFSHYMKHRWDRAPRKQNVILCLEIVAALAPRLALVAAGFWLEVVGVMLLGWFLGLAITVYLFAFLVHHPHEAVDRYENTSTIIAPAPFSQVVTWLWVYQNYHSIHHLFPRVPFYQYARVFGEIEPIMRAKGAPIYRLGSQGITAVQPDAPA